MLRLSTRGLERGISSRFQAAKPLSIGITGTTVARANTAFGAKVNVFGAERFCERKVASRTPVVQRRHSGKTTAETRYARSVSCRIQPIGSAARLRTHGTANNLPITAWSSMTILHDCHVGPCNTAGADQPARHEGYRPSGQAPTCQGEGPRRQLRRTEFIPLFCLLPANGMISVLRRIVW